MRVPAALAMIVAVLLSSGAAAATVDFEDVAVGGLAPSVTSRGFVFSAAAGNVGVQNGGQCSPQCAQNGTRTLIFGAPTNTAPQSFNPLTMNASAPFRLLGLSYAEFNGFTDARTLQVTGSLIGGGTLTRTLTLDGIIDGPGGAADFQTVTFDAVFGASLFNSVSFTGLMANFAPGGFALDNLQVEVPSAIPEPATWAMMIGGFSAVGGALRRRGARAIRAA